MANNQPILKLISFKLDEQVPPRYSATRSSAETAQNEFIPMLKPLVNPPTAICQNVFNSNLLIYHSLIRQTTLQL